MKVEVEIPDWCEDKWLYITAGMELVAFRNPKEPWKIKIERCNKCGKCCVLKEGPCEHLIYSANEYLCNLKVGRPWNCSIGLGKTKVGEECSETFE